VTNVFKLIVGSGLAIVVLAILAHPATLGPEAPLDFRLSGQVVRSLFAVVVSGLGMLLLDFVRFLRALHLHSVFSFPISTSERLAVICTHLC
jgi:hypothetical protein